MPLRTEGRHAPLDRARLMQAALGEPGVEVGAEQFQNLLLLLQLQGVGRLAECDELLLLRKVGDSGARDGDGRSEIEDVATVVAILGNRAAVGRSHDGGPELVHLDTPVIDVELR